MIHKKPDLKKKLDLIQPTKRIKPLPSPILPPVFLLLDVASRLGDAIPAGGRVRHLLHAPQPLPRQRHLLHLLPPTRQVLGEGLQVSLKKKSCVSANPTLPIGSGRP